MTKRIVLFRSYVLLLFVIAVSLTGCSEEPRPKGMPPLHPAVLTFTQDGQPLAKATVKLYPQNTAMKNWEAGGLTDEQGKAVFFTLGQYRGVAAGQYRVVVSKTDFDPSTFTGERTEEREEEFMKAEMKRQTYSLVAPKYSDPDQSDLSVEIVPGQNQQTFELGKAVRIPQP